MKLYAHFQDFVSAYVGPFDSAAECASHAHFVKERGDGAVFVGVVDEAHLPADAFILTPQEDRDWDPAK